jgi:hypothetical protein
VAHPLEQWAPPRHLVHVEPLGRKKSKCRSDAAQLASLHSQLAVLPSAPGHADRETRGIARRRTCSLGWSYAEDEVLDRLELTHSSPPRREDEP